ncbi:hypothetical protein B296_00010836 [Ensete ventricosum]|uniref:RRM domain-containing protein n=1 Tax=Ensete ventricosum TaxID=4639 RepID=A0A427ATX8_ENSVE|nr:hypothetical protein B296_00010836 [Ensete ventricosum]
MTKVFVGGLAWEMQMDALREHFEKYGEILEAVIISDKVTGRSKGYGFVSSIYVHLRSCSLVWAGSHGLGYAYEQVTFKEAEAAKKACEDATPVISGRRANCNLASLGAKRTIFSLPDEGILAKGKDHGKALLLRSAPKHRQRRERSTEKGLHDLPTRIHRRHISVESQPAGPTDVDRSKFGRAVKASREAAGEHRGAGPAAAAFY